MNISGLDKAEVLAALFNASRQQGISFLDSRGRRDMTKERAAEILKITEDFDYLEGRVMKISLDRDEVETRLYDRDNGQGSAERAIAHLVAARDKTAAAGVAMRTPAPGAAASRSRTAAPGAAASRSRTAAIASTDNSLDLTNPLNPLSPFSPLNTTFDNSPQTSSDHCSRSSHTSSDYGSSSSSSDGSCSYSSDNGSSSSSYD